jgi:teichuronic acid exporter
MSLRKLVISGLFRAGGARLLGQAFTWTVTIAVMRLLSPEDYGLLAMAMVAVAFLNLKTAVL